MKYLAVAAALAAITTAQSLAEIPSCALSCLSTAVSQSGCSLTDFSCLCGKSDVLLSAVTPCVKTACTSASDQAKLLTVYQGICQTVNVPTNAASSSASSASASTTTTQTSTQTSTSVLTTVSASTSTPTSRTASASECAAVTVTVTSTVRAAQTGYSSPPFPTTASRSSTAVFPTGTGVRTSSSPPVPQFTGAASAVRGSVFAGIFGIAAFVL